MIERDQLIDNAQAVGELIRGTLADALSGVKGVVDIRGQGLMIGIELTGEPGRMVALDYTKRLIARGLLVIPAGERVIRLLPPLNVSTAEIDEAFEKIEAELLAS